MKLKDKYTMDDLLEIMKLLRSTDGCPWDREQTHESLKKYLIEETYEVLETIDSGEKDKMYDELGDLLLQIVFHAQIASENGDFDMTDVISSICRKMISRHTHVFGEAVAETAEAVINNWEEIKKKEKGHASHTDVLRDIPKALPALMRSYKVQQKAALVGFDWDSVEDAYKKVHEEINELEEVYKSDNMERITDEMGDLLFAVVNVARFLKVQPELALNGTIEKFVRRFEYIEQKAAESDKILQEMTLSEMDELWNEAKIHNLQNFDKNIGRKEGI